MCLFAGECDLHDIEQLSDMRLCTSMYNVCAAKRTFVKAVLSNILTLLNPIFSSCEGVINVSAIICSNSAISVLWYMLHSNTRPLQGYPLNKTHFLCIYKVYVMEQWRRKRNNEGQPGEVLLYKVNSNIDKD